jgi:two-component system autoinducer 1 sensor kinase/phosphatase LuxN
VAKILIADDIEGVRRMLTQTLEDEHLVLQANNGLEAVRLAEIENPDIVMLDLDMPVMDGVEAARHIKLKFPHLKVMAMTGQPNSDNAHSVRAICDAFLEKPFRVADLREIVKMLLETTSKP